MIGRRRAIPSWFAPALLGLGLIVILAAAVSADPAQHVTASSSPFSDEGYNALNARNLVLLGRWSTDSWNLYLVELPLSTLLAGVFAVFGVGIVQARLACVAVVGLLILVFGWGLARPFGKRAASLAALAVATAGLLLYYGRLVYQEDLVIFFLAAGVLTLGRDIARRPWRWGLVGGALLALGVGTKPSAIFAVAGILAAVAVLAARTPATRRWIAGAVLGVLVAGLAWGALVWLPNRAAFANVLRIWPPFTWPTTPGSLVHRVLTYVVDNDGALRLSLPIAAMGLFGLVVVFIRRRELDEALPRLVAAAIGWLVGGLGILAVASYRPNRYVLPMLPAAGILVAAGIALAGPWVRVRLPAAARAGAVALLAVLLAAPGLVSYASWVVGAPSTAPAIQAEMAQAVPAGSVVVGVDVGLFMMRAPVVAIITAKGVPGNSGDLYHSAGARWYLTNPDAYPYSVSLPPGAWDARRRIVCAAWFNSQDCLYEVQ